MRDPPAPQHNNSEVTTATHTESGTNADAEMGSLGFNPAVPSSVVGTDPLHEFQFDSEMGPVADISTFPPTMANPMSDDNVNGMMSMDTILSSNFWDSVLVPGTFCIFIDHGQR